MFLLAMKEENLEVLPDREIKRKRRKKIET